MGSNYVNRGEAIEIKFAADDASIKPATFDVGDPVLVGARPAVAMTERTATSTKGTFWFYGKYRLSVKKAASVSVGQAVSFDTGTGASAPYVEDGAVSGDKKHWGYFLEATSITGNDAIDVVVGY